MATHDCDHGLMPEAVVFEDVLDRVEVVAFNPNGRAIATGCCRSADRERACRARLSAASPQLSRLGLRTLCGRPRLEDDRATLERHVPGRYGRRRLIKHDQQAAGPLAPRFVHVSVNTQIPVADQEQAEAASRGKR
jgi:hypothetical protein